MKKTLPGPSNLTAHSDKLLQILRDRGEWMNRAEIAAAMGKRKLTPWETQLLDLLQEAGKIEVEKRPHASPVANFRLMYRAK